MKKPINSNSVVYISGPMSGLPNFNRDLFWDVEEFVKSKYGNPKIINPADVPEDWTWEMAMEKDIKDIANGITHIILLPGWENSKGSRIELQEALKFPDVEILIFFNDGNDK